MGLDGKEWLMVITNLLNVGMWLIGWAMLRRRASEDELQRVSTRVARLEEKIEALPTGPQLTQVSVRVAELKGSVDTVAATLAATNNNVQLIHQWMLKHQ